MTDPQPSHLESDSVRPTPENQLGNRIGGGHIGGGHDVVQLAVPADSAYVAVLRTTTAAVAARLDFDLDEIDDLRIAVDEASALLLPDAAVGSTLNCTFRLEEGSLNVEVSVATRHGQLPPATSFAWTVLNALAGEVDVDKHDATSDGCVVAIRLRKTRSRAM
jgi:serine/threonine-protein kinase RsbW